MFCFVRVYISLLTHYSQPRCIISFQASLFISLLVSLQAEYSWLANNWPYVPSLTEILGFYQIVLSQNHDSLKLAKLQASCRDNEALLKLMFVSCRVMKRTELTGSSLFPSSSWKFSQNQSPSQLLMPPFKLNSPNWCACCLMRTPSGSKPKYNMYYRHNSGMYVHAQC